MQKQRKYTQIRAHTLSWCLTQRLLRKRHAMSLQRPPNLRASNNEYIYIYIHRDTQIKLWKFEIIKIKLMIKIIVLTTMTEQLEWRRSGNNTNGKCDVLVVFPLWVRQNKQKKDRTPIVPFWFFFFFFLSIFWKKEIIHFKSQIS